jgi:hypothetical protein
MGWLWPMGVIRIFRQIRVSLCGQSFAWNGWNCRGFKIKFPVICPSQHGHLLNGYFVELQEAIFLVYIVIC